MERNSDCRLPDSLNVILEKLLSQCGSRVMSCRSKGRTIRKLMGGAGEVRKKNLRKRKLNEKNSCTPINPKKIFML